MDSQGNIYPLSDLSVDQIDKVETKEDIARLDGFLRGRAEAVKLRAAAGPRRHERLVHDSRNSGTYKRSPMGIEGIEVISGDDVQDINTVLGNQDPGDEQPDEPVPAPPIEDPAQTDPPEYPDNG